MIAREMIKSLPLYERKSKLYIELFDVEEKQFELLDEQMEDFRKQFFIDTATWGLNVYEKELKIIVPSNSMFDSRRSAIKAKWRSGGKVDRALLEAISSSILQTVVKVDFDGYIEFHFTPGEKDKTGNFGLFQTVINEMKPAHLGMKIVVNHLSELNIFTGGIINEWKRTTLEPIQFNMPNIAGEQRVTGYISAWTKHTINPEVKHKWLLTRALY